MEKLHREFQANAGREYASLVEELAVTVEQRDVARQRITDAEDKLPRIRKNLEETPPYPSDETLGVQHSDEAKRRRVHRDYRMKRGRMQAEEQALEKSLTEWKVQVVRTERHLQVRLNVTRENVRQLREHAMRRVSVYLGGVVDEHPHPEVVNAYLQKFLSASADWISFQEPTDLF